MIGKARTYVHPPPFSVQKQPSVYVSCHNGGRGLPFYAGTCKTGCSSSYPSTKYTRPSEEPTASAWLNPIAGEDCTAPPVGMLRTISPERGDTAYSWWLSQPTYTVPAPSTQTQRRHQDSTTTHSHKRHNAYCRTPNTGLNTSLAPIATHGCTESPLRQRIFAACPATGKVRPRTKAAPRLC
jgi:hypothetical protein